MRSSFAIDCQTKIVKCDYTAKENFEVKVTVLPFGCILTKCIGKGNIQELKTPGIFSFGEV